MKSLLFALVSVFAVTILPSTVAKAADGVESKIIITEIKLGGGDSVGDPSTKQFVTLYNQSTEDVDLAGWKLENAKVGFPTTSCSAAEWSGSNTSSKTFVSKVLKPGQVVTVDYQLSDNADGSLRLTQQAGASTIVHDLVGWGDSAVCFSGASAKQPPSGKSIQRYLDCEATYPLSTNNNANDFAISDTPSYGILAGPVAPECEESPPGGAKKTCEAIRITELLPNPSGADEGREFIELYNPTKKTVSLYGCSLQTTGNKNVFKFKEGTQLKSGEYKAWYDKNTKLGLPNSSGGKVWLLSPTEEIQAITYPENLDDDVAWARVEAGKWQATYSLTPGAKNKLTASKPCPAGQERNVGTGRCRNINATTASNLVPCREGQKRNPATNRCRSVLSETSDLKPCAPDQFRNPETNRCKKRDSGNSLVPCREGSRRNPETNRCRKVVAAAGDLGNIHDIPSTSSGGGTENWWLAGVGATGALSYGAYEWRQEIGRLLSNIKNKFVPGGSPDL